MSDPPAGEITELLRRWSEGDRAAFNEVVEKAYGEFRAIAHSYLRRQQANAGVNTTVLVHEFYLKLFRQREPSWKALTDLEAVDSRKARLVELRYFAGCTVPEAADRVQIQHLGLKRVRPGELRTSNLLELQ